ncbi:MAG: HflX GTPase family protein, partial [Rhizobiaceae bacterium]
VGYTNAGKSTLFNRLTGAAVLAEDMLFATLDPTLRRVKLPHGTIVILSDTVGFISNLPTHLVAAFRATLEEVVEADLVMHVRDISDPDTAAQADDVERILADLGVDASDTNRVVEVWNKIDLLDEGNRERLLHEAGNREKLPPVPVSAVTGEGLDALLSLIEQKVAGRIQSLDIVLPPEQLGLIGWVYEHADVVARKDREDGGVALSLRATSQAADEIRGRLARRQ